MVFSEKCLRFLPPKLGANTDPLGGERAHCQFRPFQWTDQRPAAGNRRTEVGAFGPESWRLVDSRKSYEDSGTRSRECVPPNRVGLTVPASAPTSVRDFGPFTVSVINQNRFRRVFGTARWAFCAGHATLRGCHRVQERAAGSNGGVSHRRTVSR